MRPISQLFETARMTFIICGFNGDTRGMHSFVVARELVRRARLVAFLRALRTGRCGRVHCNLARTSHKERVEIAPVFTGVDPNF